MTAGVHCPRCGYDLSGAVDSWSDRCPVRGVCPECGLEYLWGNILDPSSVMAPWYIESNSSLRKTFLRTAVRAFRPWRFWREVVIEMPMRLGRAVLTASLWFILWQFVFVLGIAGLLAPRVIEWYRLGGWSWMQFELSEYFMDFRYGDPLVLMALLIVIPYFAMPLLYSVLGQSLGRAKVRRAHLLRIGADSFFIYPVGGWITQVFVFATYKYRGGGDPDAAIATMACALLWTPLTLILYWAFAGRRYLRIKRAWVVAIVLGFTAALSTISIPTLIAYLFYM